MAYLIPAKRERCELKVKNSRFIATLDQCPSAERAREILAGLREEFPGATHHVYAFKAGHGASVVEGMSDDGEPSGTGGPPVMAVLRGSGAGDAIIVITRYFGGTKLGTGGLVSAYQKSAQEVMARAELIEKVAWVPLRLSLEYAHLEGARRLFGEFGVREDEADYGERVELALSAPQEAAADLGRALQQLSAGRARLSGPDGASD